MQRVGIERVARINPLQFANLGKKRVFLRGVSIRKFALKFIFSENSPYICSVFPSLRRGRRFIDMSKGPSARTALLCVLFRLFGLGGLFFYLLEFVALLLHQSHLYPSRYYISAFPLHAMFAAQLHEVTLCKIGGKFREQFHVFTLVHLFFSTFANVGKAQCRSPSLSKIH